MKTASVLTILLVFFVLPAAADQPDRMSKFIIELRNPEDVPHPQNGKKPEKTEEPDVEKLGGKVHGKSGNQRLITLPEAAYQKLKNHPSVFMIQRVWNGEPLEWFDDPKKSRLEQETTSTEVSDGMGKFTWESGAYAYDGSGNIRAIGTDTYRYDSAHRLIQSSTNLTPETYGYDAFGNLIAKSTGGGPNSVNAVDPWSNKLIGFEYDVAGNLKTYGIHSYEYDALSMMVLLRDGPGKRMIYTADDERIAVQTPSMLGVAPTRWTIRDFDGRPVREFSGEYWEWEEDWAYLDGRAIGAERMPEYGGRRHFHLDHLGTPRVITLATPLRLSKSDYYPFGKEQTLFSQEVTDYNYDRPEFVKFTGHERDILGYFGEDHHDYVDYMHARFYNPIAGRFLSVDPGGWDARRPQTWNRYAYAENNPVNKIDPDGREAQAVVGALVGGFVGMGFAAYSEIRLSLAQPVTWGGSTRRFLGAVSGGALAGALASTCGNCAWGVRLGSSSVGSVIGGILNRGVSGAPQTLEAAQRDAVAGAAGFVVAGAAAQAGTALAAGKVDQLVVQGAVARAEAAAANAGLGADKAAGQAIQTIQNAIATGGAVVGEAAGNVTGNNLPRPDPKKREEEERLRRMRDQP
jgi:RHS repeat-associated protein